MPSRKIKIAKIGEVTLTKRRGSRNMRLSVNPAGQVRVSMPYWTPYSAAIMLISQHQEWLLGQMAATKKISLAEESAIKLQAQRVLPARTQLLSRQYSLPYNNLRIKKMTSRWGSCSIKGNISLSYYLVQLTPELVDYVILHELAHTKYPNHGVDFWAFMKTSVPNLKEVRRQLRQYRPTVH